MCASIAAAMPFSRIKDVGCSGTLSAGVLCTFLMPLLLGVSHADPVSGTKVKVKGQFTSGQNRGDCRGRDCALRNDKDISGAVCLSKKLCFAASDETRFVQQFSFSSGEIKAGRRVYLGKTEELRERRGETDEFDLEALARFKSGVFAVGSHSWKRQDCEPHATRLNVFYFKPAPDGVESRKTVKAKSFSLRKLIRRESALDAGFDQPLQANGLNIEGAAVLGRRLYIGFRAPIDQDDARKGFVLSLDADSASRGKRAKADLHTLRFAEKGLGIRAMEPYGKGILLLTGDSGAPKSDMSNPPEAACRKNSRHLGNEPQLYFWKPNAGSLKLIAEIKRPKKDWKAEGLLVVPGQAKNAKTVRLMIFFDGASKGAPRLIRLDRKGLK